MLADYRVNFCYESRFISLTYRISAVFGESFIKQNGRQ